MRYNKTNWFQRNLVREMAKPVSGLLRIGEQVAYVPTHANGDISHEDVEFGFVTAPSGNPHANPPEAYFVRYWSNYYEEGPVCEADLRTRANSEATPVECLAMYTSVPQSTVSRVLVELGYLEQA